MRKFLEGVELVQRFARTQRVGVDGGQRGQPRVNVLELNIALKALAEEGTVPMEKVAEAIAKYKIKTDKINPLYA